MKAARFSRQWIQLTQFQTLVLYITSSAHSLGPIVPLNQIYFHKYKAQSNKTIKAKILFQVFVAWPNINGGGRCNESPNLVTTCSCLFLFKGTSKTLVSLGATAQSKRLSAFLTQSYWNSVNKYQGTSPIKNGNKYHSENECFCKNTEIFLGSEEFINSTMVRLLKKPEVVLIRFRKNISRTTEYYFTAIVLGCATGD